MDPFNLPETGYDLFCYLILFVGNENIWFDFF